MGLLSGFKAKLKSNKYKKSPEIVCVNYKINTSFDEPGSSFTYRSTAIWNNSPKLTDKNKATTRSPGIERTKTTSFTSEISRNSISGRSSFNSESNRNSSSKINGTKPTSESSTNSRSTQSSSKRTEELTNKNQNYRRTAIWNNSPKLTDKNKTTTRSPRTERIKTSFTSDRSSSSSISGRRISFNSESDRDSNSKIKSSKPTNESSTNSRSTQSSSDRAEELTTKNLRDKEEHPYSEIEDKGLQELTNQNQRDFDEEHPYSKIEDERPAIQREFEEHPYNEIQDTGPSSLGHYEELDENTKSILIFMTEDHDSKKVHENDINNNHHEEDITSVDSGINSSTTVEDKIKTDNVSVNERKGASFSEENDTGKSVRFAERDSYHTITPTSNITYYFSSTEEDEDNYEVKIANYDDLSLDESDERRDSDSNSNDNDRTVQETKHNTDSFHFYNGMAFSSQASNIFFGGDDFEGDQEEENTGDNVSHASSFSA